VSTEPGAAHETEAALNSVEEATKDFFRLVLHELKELEDDDGLQE
jgi:hypothetical protein